jgi:hypothetical protein
MIVVVMIAAVTPRRGKHGAVAFGFESNGHAAPLQMNGWRSGDRRREMWAANGLAE